MKTIKVKTVAVNIRVLDENDEFGTFTLFTCTNPDYSDFVQARFNRRKYERMMMRREMLDMWEIIEVNYVETTSYECE